MLCTLRSATSSDARLISRLVIDGWRESYAAFLPASLIESLDYNPHHDAAAWRERIAAPTARTWIAVDVNGTDIGVARLDLASSVPETRSELTTLYIAASWQGKGIGATALDDVRAEVARLDALPMGIGVLAGNVRVKCAAALVEAPGIFR